MGVKRGRPRKEPSVRLSRLTGVRFTEREWEEIRKQVESHGEEYGAWARRVLKVVARKWML